MLKKFKLLMLSSLLISGGAASCKNGEKEKRKINKETVAAFELEKYLGKWYEIARYDHTFERGLVGVTATYSLKEDGKILVLNQGYKNSLNGKLKSAKGKARKKDKSKEGVLEVSFFLSFYADYLVLELAEDYSYAVIGSSSDKYLWILSRSPQMEEASKQNIIRIIENRGYDTSALIWVPQKEKQE